MKKILNYPVLIFMLFNCLVQQYLARTQHMDVWLGGGFGMFSGVNFVDGRTIVCRIKLGNGEEHSCFLQDADPIVRSKLQIFPSDYYVNQLKEEILAGSFYRHDFGYQFVKKHGGQDDIEKIRIEIWEKTYDADKRTLGIKQIAAFDFKK